jgi:hypothetical protein
MFTATQQNYDAIQQQVCYLINWTVEKHNEYIYDSCLIYLQYYIGPQQPVIIHCLTSSKVFWAWWKMHWFAREKSFLDGMVVMLRHDWVMDIYYELHDSKTLAKAIYPSGVVLEEGYNLMIAELIKEEVAI